MAGGHPAGGWPEAARKFSLSVCLSSIPQRYISAVYRYPGTGDLTQFVRGVLIESERHRACESDFTEAIRSSPTFTRPDSIKTIKPIEFSGSLAKYRRKKYPAPECPVLEPFHETGQRSIILFALGLIEPRLRGS